VKRMKKVLMALFLLPFILLLLIGDQEVPQKRSTISEPTDWGKFVAPMMGYVYGTPEKDETLYVMIYWCYPKKYVNGSLAIGLSSLMEIFSSASYNGRHVPVFYRGYLGLAVPINVSRFPVLLDAKYIDATVSVHLMRNYNESIVKVYMGNWTLETGKLPKMMPNITSYTLESIEFTRNWIVTYKFGLYNPYNVTIKFLNISFELPGIKVLNITVYNASTFYGVNETTKVNDFSIPPGESRYFVITLLNDPEVNFFLRPKIEYLVGSEKYIMPGPPFQLTYLKKECWVNMKKN